MDQVTRFQVVDPGSISELVYLFNLFDFVPAHRLSVIFEILISLVYFWVSSFLDHSDISFDFCYFWLSLFLDHSDTRFGFCYFWLSSFLDHSDIRFGS